MSKDQKRRECRYAQTYQAMRPPTCGCKACEDKWANAQRDRQAEKGQPIDG